MQNEDNPYHFIFGSKSLDRIKEYAANNGYALQKNPNESLSVANGGLEICIINLGMPLQVIRTADVEQFRAFYSGMVKALDHRNPLTGQNKA